MLVLSRKEQEKICVGEDIVITIVKIAGGQVRVGIEAPRDVSIRRFELTRKDDENVSSA
jgi:carbon storage regulator CsrA